MKEKKHIIKCLLTTVIVVCILVLVICIFFFPMSLEEKIVSDNGYSVIVNEIEDTLSEEDVLETDIQTLTYYFENGSEETDKLLQIVSNYKYHRTLATIFTAEEEQYLSGTECGYFITIIGDDNSVASGGTTEVAVNDKIYGIGYFGNGKALEMMKELKDFLDTCTPYTESSTE